MHWILLHYTVKLQPLKTKDALNPLDIRKSRD
jgi:hypothetical protein